MIFGQYLSDETAILATNALVSSLLDYYNSLFGSLSNQHAQTEVYSKYTC